MNDTKILAPIFIFILLFTLTYITILTSHYNKTLETELYETKQELSTERFNNRILEQQLHQLREKNTP